MGRDIEQFQRRYKRFKSVRHTHRGDGHKEQGANTDHQYKPHGVDQRRPHAGSGNKEIPPADKGLPCAREQGIEHSHNNEKGDKPFEPCPQIADIRAQQDGCG